MWRKGKEKRKGDTAANTDSCTNITLSRTFTLQKYTLTDQQLNARAKCCAAKALHGVSLRRGPGSHACYVASVMSNALHPVDYGILYGILREETQLEWAAIYYSGGLPYWGIKPTSHTPAALAGRRLTHSSHSQTWTHWWAVAGDPLPKGKGLVEKTFFKPFKTNNTV